MHVQSSRCKLFGLSVSSCLNGNWLPVRQRILFKLSMLVSRACLDQHLIAIRSPVIRGDHLRSRTSLIAITSTAQLLGSGLSHLLYKLGLTRHLATSCTVLIATRGVEDSRRSITASAASCALWGGRSRSV